MISIDCGIQHKEEDATCCTVQEIRQSQPWEHSENVSAHQFSLVSFPRKRLCYYVEPRAQPTARTAQYASSSPQATHTLGPLCESKMGKKMKRPVFQSGGHDE
jgi:hypothetical protein